MISNGPNNNFDLASHNNDNFLHDKALDLSRIPPP